MRYQSICSFQDFKRTKNNSFLDNMLIDNEENLRPFKVDRKFMKECLRINGRSIELLHKYDPSILLDKELLRIAYQSVGPVLMRSLSLSYRKSVRNILNRNIRTTLKKNGTMIPKILRR